MGAGCSGEAVTEWQDKASEAASSVQDWYAEVEENISDDEDVATKNQDTLVKDGSLVMGDGFSLTIPEEWIVTPMSSPTRISDGRYTYGWIKSGVMDDAYGDPDIIMLTIEDVEKEERTYEEIVAEYGWDQTDIDERVTFMQENAHPPYNALSGEDVSVLSGKVTIQNQEANYSEIRCEHVCFIEGSAMTTGLYFIDAEELVYLVRISVGTNEYTDTHLEQAEEVVKTFTIQ